MTSKPVIYTIGHSTISLVDFMTLVEFWGLQAVVDVRSKPYSQYNPHFNKEVLMGTFHRKCIDYYWRGKTLGGLCKTSIKDENFLADIKFVADLAKKGLKTAIMCSESQPLKCHRAYKLSPVFLGQGFQVRHLIQKTQEDGAEFQSKRRNSWLWEECQKQGELF